MFKVVSSYPVVREVHGGDAWDVREGVSMNRGQTCVHQVKFFKAMSKILELILSHLKFNITDID
jgi:hypothetical protein